MHPKWSIVLIHQTGSLVVDHNICHSHHKSQIGEAAKAEAGSLSTFHLFTHAGRYSTAWFA